MREGWKRVKLGEIITLRRGLTYKKDDEVGFSEKIVLRSNNVDLSKHLFDYDELKYLRADFDIPIDKYIKQGELLMCMSNGSKAHLGKVALYEGQDNIYAFGGFMSAISHNELISSKFLYYALITSRFKDYINTLSAGANINNLKTKDIDAYSIEIPSLSEQERIVSLLDLEFAKIDAIKANAEKQLQNAKDLFQSALKDLLTPKEGWELKYLGDIAVDMYRGSGITRAQVTREGISCVRYGEIYTTYSYWFDKCVSHTDEQAISSRKYFEYGDVLFAITGESVEDIGKSIVYLGNEKCLAGGDIVVMKHELNPKFLAYVLSSPDVVRQKGLGKTKLKVVHTNVPSLKSIVIYIPSTMEQEQIANKLDLLSKKVESMKSNLQKILPLCNDLKQSILKDIFG